MSDPCDSLNAAHAIRRASLTYGAGVTALLNRAVALDLGYFGEASDDNRIGALRLTLRLEF